MPEMSENLFLLVCTLELWKDTTLELGKWI
jgi:hypothetical protein